MEGITHKACSVWRAERVSVSPETEDLEPGDTRAHLSAAEINTALADRHSGRRWMKQTAMWYLNKLNCPIKLKALKTKVCVSLVFALSLNSRKLSHQGFKCSPTTSYNKLWPRVSVGVCSCHACLMPSNQNEAETKCFLPQSQSKARYFTHCVTLIIVGYCWKTSPVVLPSCPT